MAHITFWFLTIQGSGVAKHGHTRARARATFLWLASKLLITINQAKPVA